MRPTGSKKELEARRRVAVKLRRSGMTIREVAKVVGCAPGSVARWEGLYLSQGDRGLDPIPNAGGTPRLDEKEQARLARMLTAGPRAHGYEDGVWTLRRVRDLIARRFGVQYGISNVHRMLRVLGFSAQKPQLRAIERDELAIEKFRKRGWAEVKKSPRKRAKRSR
jgi:transposase